MNITNWESRRELRNYADWLAGNPNLQVTKDGVWIMSRTNNKVAYKGWSLITGERVL